MKIITDCPQGGESWLKLRLGVVTASEAGNLLTPNFEIRNGEMPHTYLCQKVAEAYRGQVLPGFGGSWETEQGAINEMEARHWLSFATDKDVRQVDFVVSDDGRYGCSPDGLIGEDSGLELKCVQPVNHVKWLLEGTLPKEHAVQVHFSMYVTGRPEWVFLSYQKKFPKLLLTVKRDEEKFAKIKEALDIFAEKFDKSIEKLRRFEQ